MQYGRCILEEDRLVGETRAIVWVLIEPRAVFEIEGGTEANLPATITPDVLNVMERAVQETEGSIVVQVGVVAAGCADTLSSPVEGCALVGVELLKGDETVVEGIEVGEELEDASSGVTATAPLEGTAVVHGVHRPVVAGRAVRAAVVELDQTAGGVGQVTIVGVVAVPVVDLSTDSRVGSEPGELVDKQTTGVDDVAIEGVVGLSVQHVIDTC